MISIFYTILPIVTMIIGFYFGFNLKKDKLPEVKTPSKIIKEHKEQKQMEEEQSELQQYLANIDNYPYDQVGGDKWKTM